METMGKCPNCGDTMTEQHSNYLPVWSDRHDDIVCWWCANHARILANATIENNNKRKV